MENEFDFFNNLNFGTDFTKKGLGGYGTFSGEYLDPTVTLPINTQNFTGGQMLSGIQTAAPIDMIPAPITPFINQGSNKDDNGGIKTIKTPIDAPINLVDEAALTTAKKDTNIKNLINMGLVKQAKDYVKNNYGYMIMNTLFFGSGYAAKAFVDNKKKKEETERLEALAQIEQARKQKEAQAIIAAAEEQATREAATAARARAANPNVYASADAQGFTSGGGGFASQNTGTNENFSNNTGRGRTGYGTGGIVTL